MSTVKRLYRCPSCGEVMTDEEFEKSLSNGGMPYCYCEFGPPKNDPDGGFQRTFIEYEVFVKEEKP